MKATRGATNEHQGREGGHGGAEEKKRSREKVRFGNRFVSGAEDYLGQIINDQHQRKGEEQLVNLFLDIDAPQKRDFDKRGDGRHAQGGQQQGQEETGRTHQIKGDPIDQVSAQHVKRAVGEVEDIEDPKNQGQP